MTYGSTWPTYAKQWDSMERTRLTMARQAAADILEHKSRYETVAQKFNAVHDSDLPWYFIGPIHYREADLDFGSQLAQGDPLGKVSTHVPAGEGPYFGEDAWERAAIIALEGRKLHKRRDWRLEKLLYEWEEYNGEGYRNKGLPSPYVWAGSNVDRGGMFVRDHVFDPNAHDKRVGCAPILKCLMEMDPTVRPVRETPPGVEPAPAPQPAPQPTEPQMPVPTTPTVTDADIQQAMRDAFRDAARDYLNKPETKTSMSAILASFGTWLISVLPQLSAIGLGLFQTLVANGAVGGIGATPTGTSIGSALLTTLGVGVLNWVKNSLPKQDKKQ